jgi:probable rRNA maturation factor
MRTGRGSQPPGLAVVAVNRQRRRRVDTARLTAVLRGAAEALSVRGEVALVLAGDRALRTLNRRYRGKDKPTDVLSFPGPCHEHAGPLGARRDECAACVGQAPGLGDIVISVDTAARNARRLGRTLPRELEVLALHGFLHVLGYDHETDDGTMDRLERRLRKRLLAAPAARPRAAGAGVR